MRARIGKIAAMVSRKGKNDMTPNADAQHKRLTLVVTTGMNGYRIAYVGGYDFEVIADGLTADQAVAAKRAAEEATGVAA